MRASRYQIVLAAGLLVAALMGGGTQARAGYVSVAGLQGDEAIDGLSPFVASPLAEREVTAGISGSAALFQPVDADEIPSPVAPAFPFVKLPHVAHAFARTGSAGSSSNGGSDSGPSNPPVGDASRPQAPPLVLAHLLPPDRGESHPFSVASFLFRPPRAA